MKFSIRNSREFEVINVPFEIKNNFLKLELTLLAKND